MASCPATNSEILSSEIFSEILKLKFEISHLKPVKFKIEKLKFSLKHSELFSETR